MRLTNIAVITSHTFRESIRAKWLLMYAVVFFLLAVNVPILVLLATRYLPPGYLGVYLDALVTLSFPFLPLLALPMGATSVVEERETGSLQFVLSNPISRLDYLLGRMLGLLLATTGVVVLGYGVAAGITFNVDLSRYEEVGQIVLIAAGLNAIMVGLSLFISVMTRRRLTALGIAIFVWFLFSVLSNIGLFTAIVNLTLGPHFALPFIMVNPIEIARILATIVLGADSGSLGLTGMTVVYLLKDSAVLDIVLIMLAWIAVTFAATIFAFRRQDAV